MASKVNTKFVVALSAGLLVVAAGVAFTAARLLKNSGADLIAAGDARLAEGKIEDAVGLYAKAVNKEKTNVAFLRKWVETQEKLVPDSQLKYEKQFEEYRSGLRQLATLEGENLANAKKYLDIQLTLIRSGPYREADWSFLAGEIDTFLRPFADKPTPESERLRRYRGLVNLRRVLESAAPDAAMLASAKADLDAALKADPTDVEAELLLAEVDARDAERVRRSNPEEYAALMGKVEARMDAFLGKYPGSPQMLMAKVQFDLGRTRARVTPTMSDRETTALAQEFAGRAVPLLEQAFATAKSMPQPVSETIVRSLMNGEMLADPASRLGRTEGLLREGLKVRPAHAPSLLLLAEIAKQRGDYTTANEQLEKVAGLADLPVSLEGMSLFSQRRGALLQQALWSVRQWQLLPAGAERDAMFAKCKELRDRAATVAADDTRLLFVDAQLAYVTNTPDTVARAAQLLDEYNRKTGNSDVEALLLTAQVAVQRNQPGLARDTLNRLLQLQPNSVTALMAMGELERSFQQFDAAKTYFRQALRFSPGNEAATRALANLEALSDPTKATDPLVKELATINQLQREIRDTPGANQRILEALKPLEARFNFDPRVSLPLSQAYLVNNDRENAIKVLQRSLEKFPDNKQLAMGVQMLNEPDPFKRQLLGIDIADVPEIEKLLSKQQLYRAAGKEEDAKRMLAEAVKAAPEDKRVIEAQFIEAIERGDVATAKPIADRAVRENIDNYNGDTYRARLLAAEGQPGQAATLLKGIVERGGAQPEVHRLLGRMLVADNRTGEAAEAYREALRLRPTDPQIAVDLITTLAATGRTTEALTASREFRPFGENDLAFVKLWLALEAEAGDRELAIRQREQIASTLADDRQNALSLIQLYLQTNRIEQARTMIDKSRARSDGLDLAGLDAALLWAQGKVPEAKKAFEDAVAKFQTTPPTSLAERAYASFLSQRGDVQGALDALNRARKVQDPKLMEADRAISDLGISIGAADLASLAARNVVEGNADTPTKTYHKRLVETLLAQGKVDEAAAELAKLPSGTSVDAQTLLLAAQVAELQKDMRKAMNTLNDAVTRFPRDIQVFMRRGEMLMREKSTQSDAVQDFGRVIELAPDNPLGYRLRAQAYELLGEARKADQDVRAAIRVAPNDDTVVFGYMGELALKQSDEVADELAREVLKSRPRDVGYMMRTAVFFRNRGRADLAQRWCREAFAQDQSDSVALSYLATLLDVPRPDTAEAERVLAALGERTRTNPLYMMATAKVRFSQNKGSEAVKLAQDSLRLLRQDEDRTMLAWFSDMRRMVTDKAQLRQVLQGFAGQGVAPEWMAYFRAQSLLEEPATKSEGSALLEQLVKSATLTPVRRLVFNQRGEMAYSAGQYEAAAASWREGVKEFPQDLPMANNLAYVLTKHLGKHEEALPLAEAAAKGLENQPDILDTLGLVYLNLNRNEEAGQVFERAGQLATTPTSAITIGTHYVESLRRLGKVDVAKGFVDRMQPLFESAKDQLSEEVRRGWDAARDGLK